MQIFSRRLIVTLICIVAGALHFVTGPGYGGPFPDFVNGYLIDILLPAAMYLLLWLPELPWLRRPLSRALLVFAVGAGTETLQYFGVPLFGSTFDPLDCLAFAAGIACGWMFERMLLDRFFPPRLSRNASGTGTSDMKN